MRRDLFQPSAEGEIRLLLLIDAFSTGAQSCLEGRTKLAKLDFFLRYPIYFDRAMSRRSPQKGVPSQATAEDQNIETRMVRYRYGPWDPAYFALLGRLIGKGLVATVPVSGGLGFRSTGTGRELARQVANTEAWAPVRERTRLLKRHLNLSGTALKDFVYQHFPEVAGASWGEQL